MKRDRFQTAGRLAEQLQELAPRDAKEEMRPLTPAQVTERAQHSRNIQHHLQDFCAVTTIEQTVNRFLRRRTTVAPTPLDHAIIARMDDGDLGYYTWIQGDLDALKVYRQAAIALEAVS